MNYVLKLLGLSRVATQPPSTSYPMAPADPGWYFGAPKDYLKWRIEKISVIRQLWNIDELRTWLRHQDGYLREAALLRAEALQATALWPDLLHRVNDWVPDIRLLAKRIGLRWLQQTPANELLAHLPDVGRLQGAQREDHSLFIEQFEATLATPANLSILLQHARVFTAATVARYCFVLLVRTGMDAKQLIELGLESPDFVVHSQMLRLMHAMPFVEQARWATRLLDSPRDYLKWHGLTILANVDATRAVTLAAAYVLSPYSALRHKAQRLSGISNSQLLEAAERLVGNSGARSGEINVALSLFAGTGERNYTALIHGFFTHPSVRVQATALVALATISPELATPKILKNVASERSTLGRSAVAAAKIMDYPDIDQWKRWVRQSANTVALLRMLAWASDQGRWVALGLLLEVAAVYPQHLAFCNHCLDDWQLRFNGSYTVLDDTRRRWIFENVHLLPGPDEWRAKILFYVD